LRLVRWRPVFVRLVCLSCGSGLARTGMSVGTTVDGFGKRRPTRWTEYRCRRCSAEFVGQDGKGLVPRDAWAAAPVPGARIVE
jgi:hypothetical protein